jgi:hypothetical protein
MRHKLLPLFLTTLAILIIAIEPSIAGNKFTTIGGGVSGTETEKLNRLKDLTPWAGGFFIVMAIGALLTKNRYEGLIGLVTGKKTEAVSVVPIVLFVLGLVLIGVYFI